MTTAKAPRKRTTPLRASEVPDIAPRRAPVPAAPAPTAPASIPTVGTVPPSPDQIAMAQAVQAANREMTIGAAILVIAGLITFVWWRIAVADAETDGSGSYFVFYGPMIWGAIRLFRGVRYRLNPRALLQK